MEETKVVVRNSPFQVTVSLAVKFEPFTVRVKAAAPEATLEGEMDEMSGLLFTTGSIVNDAALETPPPGAGLITVIWMTLEFKR